MQTHWRLALMFDTPGHDLSALTQGLNRLAPEVAAIAAGHHVRLGVADRHADLGATATRVADKGWADVDGAIEITVANARIGEIPALCASLRPVMVQFCAAGTVDVMAGPMFSMVPVRSGSTFLSLAFRRDRTITSQEFHSWWLDHHAAIAIPVLGEGLLAYDQVHVEAQVSMGAAEAFGAGYVAYDAYDNLTWRDRHGYLNSISDPEAMGPLLADEIGFIDQSSRRSAMMTVVG